jgi:Ni,Fe-hydrogenase III large subunit
MQSDEASLLAFYNLRDIVKAIEKRNPTQTVFRAKKV